MTNLVVLMLNYKKFQSFDSFVCLSLSHSICVIFENFRGLKALLDAGMFAYDYICICKFVYV